jgi:gamma-glutamyl-gamma-aminobutyrate hydrolase PuuD
MRIGLTQRVLFHKDRAYDSLEHSWYELLQGHTLIPIANRLPVDPANLDALIITGGDNHPMRDQVEQELINYMFLKKRPIIGICHGCQILTEKLGGQLSLIDDHMDTDHQVIYHGQQHWVNSYHKVSISQVPRGAITLASDQDGHAEAWIYGRTAAVMWHPERMEQPWIPAEIQQLLT